MTNRTIVDRENLPEAFPTHHLSSEFWEHLGRAVASFGCLEEILGKAIFAFTATRRYPANEIEDEYRRWIPKLERALTEPLKALADSYAKSVRDHPDASIQNIDELKADLYSAADIRNMLCHGSWRLPDSEGFSAPYFINKRKEICTTRIDILYLKDVRTGVSELCCNVVDTVTHMGWAFPGSYGPGQRISVP